MCGIAGIFDIRGHGDVDRVLLRQMTDSLGHRGPDGAGFYHAPGIGFGHRRLAILDLETGHQPMFNEDRTVCVVFNGEIYNHRPLMAELKQLGHRFHTRSDTEVLIHAWEQWSEDCLARFNGMFAFGLWDSRRETLFLARDRLGEKPLYYSLLGNGRLLFASELKSLRLSPDIDRRLDPRAIEEFFAYGYIPDPRSIYLGVRKLPPGHFLLIQRGELPAEPRCYWDVRFDNGPSVRNGDVAEQLIERLRESVRMRMIADVPLGAFLSGGVDSSGIVAMMAGLSADPVGTFSIAFGSKALDESAYAAEIAARYRTDHHVRRVDPNAFDLLDRLAAVYDEPFGDSSAIPTFRVCATARENVTVALSGDGADEVFAGYRRYRWHCLEERVRRVVPGDLRRPLFGVLGTIYPKLDWAPRPLRAKAVLEELAQDAEAAYFSSVSVCGDELRQRLFSPGLKRDLQGYHAGEVLRWHMRHCDSEDPLLRVQYADLKTYLPGDILTKVDRASMASSLEVRVPYLDHTLVEWAARLPSSVKLRGGEGKHVLKTALEAYVGKRILYRPKQGFVVPLASWFRGPLRGRLREALLGRVLRQSGLFDIPTIAALLDQHQSGVRDHSPVLWMLSIMESFLRQIEAGEPSATASAEIALPEELSAEPLAEAAPVSYSSPRSP